MTATATAAPAAETAKPEPKPLPAIASITSVAPTAIPSSAGPALTDAEIALAKAIVNACADGNLAVGEKCADRKDATATAARMRRLVARYLGTLTPPDPRKVGTRIVAKDGGQAWAIALVQPEAVAEDAPSADAETPAEA
jgi:hypothetical protein